MLDASGPSCLVEVILGEQPLERCRPCFGVVVGDVHRPSAARLAQNRNVADHGRYSAGQCLQHRKAEALVLRGKREHPCVVIRVDHFITGDGGT